MRFVDFLILTTLWISFGVHSAHAEECNAQYGEVVNFDHCHTVTLPDFSVHYEGLTQPNPQVRMSCKNYQIIKGKKQTPFQQCNSGLLGGMTKVDVGDQEIQVIFDVAKSCDTRGNVFFFPSLSSSQFSQFTEKNRKFEDECAMRQSERNKNNSRK